MYQESQQHGDNAYWQSVECRLVKEARETSGPSGWENMVQGYPLDVTLHDVLALPEVGPVAGPKRGAGPKQSLDRYPRVHWPEPEARNRRDMPREDPMATKQVEPRLAAARILAGTSAVAPVGNAVVETLLSEHLPGQPRPSGHLPGPQSGSIPRGTTFCAIPALPIRCGHQGIKPVVRIKQLALDGLLPNPFTVLTPTLLSSTLPFCNSSLCLGLGYPPQPRLQHTVNNIGRTTLYVLDFVTLWVCVVLR